MTTKPVFSSIAAALLLCLGAVPALAANRMIAVDAPPRAAPGSPVYVVISAWTDAGDRERVGFLYVRYSADGGRHWSGLCLDETGGPKATRSFTIPAGAAGSQLVVSAMAAFRGGRAGDVDFTGAPINWGGSWAKWESPPAREIVIDVGAR